LGNFDQESTKFVCECLRSIGRSEAPTGNIALVFVMATISTRVYADSSVKAVNAVQAQSKTASLHCDFGS